MHDSNPTGYRSCVPATSIPAEPRLDRDRAGVSGTNSEVAQIVAEGGKISLTPPVLLRQDRGAKEKQERGT